MSPPALALSGITCRFPATGKAPAYVAVQGTSLTLAAGEFVAVVGPTGCGKSTLLNVAAGLLVPTEGTTTLFGAPLRGLNRQAGYMFQADSLLPWLNARDNVALGPELHGTPRREARAQADAWLARVGLRGAEHRYLHQLSGGMKKRVALAQTLILDPKILLMDEPFSALDIQTRQMMENELLDLWSQDRKSVLFVTHDLEEAIALADRVIVLSAGPATHPVADYAIDIPRPRDVTELVHTPRFAALHRQIWATLKQEVLRGK